MESRSTTHHCCGRGWTKEYQREVWLAELIRCWWLNGWVSKDHNPQSRRTAFAFPPVVSLPTPSQQEDFSAFHGFQHLNYDLPTIECINYESCPYAGRSCWGNGGDPTAITVVTTKELNLIGRYSDFSQPNTWQCDKSRTHFWRSHQQSVSKRLRHHSRSWSPSPIPRNVEYTWWRTSDVRQAIRCFQFMPHRIMTTISRKTSDNRSGRTVTKSVRDDPFQGVKTASHTSLASAYF